MSLAPTISGSQVFQGLSPQKLNNSYQGVDPFRSKRLLKVDPLMTQISLTHLSELKKVMQWGNS
jgi:hypothetical protein